MMAVAAQGIESLVAASPCPSAFRHFKSRCLALRPTIRRHGCRLMQSAPVVLLVVAVLVGGIVFSTDGVLVDTPTSVVRRAAPEGIARQLLAHGDKCTDNALMVAVRFWGG
jgi:hypothetical protein